MELQLHNRKSCSISVQFFTPIKILHKTVQDNVLLQLMIPSLFLFQPAHHLLKVRPSLETKRRAFRADLLVKKLERYN